MAGGWSRDGAVQDQIDATVEDALKRARSEQPSGDSLEYCDECGENIPEARRMAVPGVRFCVQCQSAKDKTRREISPFNRRGSKDSQLR
ncbi:DksA/TraR family C4-type zinc finger protein [Parasphingopyxis marina]|uniref:DksA/TraR family C4-type zinc finger protein n=1 Tax=Parasphingopyxis marina TaxID=2761622 RepID=A0A842HY57_9SPHN|nr:DksA/TraR family C4-type zinc finger protein [Parasphingopyxis marina]MBC2777383.1 DksA/TraR family C4-type zinc finger protein [Parasphingopyxis marina]